MQNRWTEKNIDLDLLSNRIEDFFKDRGFLTKRTQSEGERTIFWTSEATTIRLKDPMRAKIIGDSNDFVIELVASELTLRPIRLGLLTKSFGGGYFALRGLRLRETLQKLETEFWAYMEDKIIQLTDSAKPS